MAPLSAAEIAHREAQKIRDSLGSDAMHDDSDLTPVEDDHTADETVATSISEPGADAKPSARKGKAKVKPVAVAGAEDPETKPKKRARKQAEPELDDEGNPIEPKPKRARKKAEPEYDAEGNEIVKPKRVRKKKEPQYDAEGNEIVKPSRKLDQPKPDPVYDMPDVQKLHTDFQGRLGYACLNSVLRNRKPARFAVFCARTLRIATIKEKGMDFLKETALANVKDLLEILKWNEANNIRFFRLSSEMFPFASHEEYGYDLSYAAEELKACGDFAKAHGHRLTTHPGQFTQLGSPKPKVVENAIRDLQYHCEMLDRMGMGKDSVMIIHGGGTYQDKDAAIERIKANWKRLPKNVADRIVLENDELSFSAGDLLPLCEAVEAPFVLDYHHDWIYPSSKTVAELMPRILATWDVRGGIKPKQHLSEPRPGAVSIMERRAHSDRIKRLPDALPRHVDLMLEAKDKEQAVLELYRTYSMHDVDPTSLRPPNPNPTLATGGRKSHSPKKKGADDEDAEAGEDDDEKPVLDDDGDAKPRKRARTTTADSPTKKPSAKKAAKAVADKLVQPEPEDIAVAVKIGQSSLGEAALPTPESAQPFKLDARKNKLADEASLVDADAKLGAKKRRTSKASKVKREADE